MTKYIAVLAAAIATLASGTTQANENGWLLNGATLGAGRNAVHGEVGWPAISLTLLHGTSDKVDVGGYFAFMYGFEGVEDISPGAKLGAAIRLNMINDQKFNLGVKISPGVFTYFPTDHVYGTYYRGVWYLEHYDSSDTMFGIGIPVEVTAGFIIQPKFSLHAAVSIPMHLFFTPDVSFVMPFEFGGGLEYKVDSALSLTVDSRVGPAFFMVPGDSYSRTAYRFMLGLGYRF